VELLIWEFLEAHVDPQYDDFWHDTHTLPSSEEPAHQLSYCGDRASAFALDFRTMYA
jgi:hypothetical protein